MIKSPTVPQSLFQRMLKDAPRVDFLTPQGEAALIPSDSVSWRVFKNPVALFIGGITAVLLELGEPRVRAGVWGHTSFRTNPVQRMQRTGMAAMVTVYAAHSVAEKMIAGVNRMHGQVTGKTPDGAYYQANDSELLNWVQATASFGFLQAYCTFVEPLSDVERDRFYVEGSKAAALYGAAGAPHSLAEQEAQFAAMLPRLEASPIIFEFLDIIGHAGILPSSLRGLQNIFIRAAIEILPAEVKERLGLQDRKLKPWERRIVRLAGKASDVLPIPGMPGMEACQRLGLPKTYLYRKR